MRPKTVHNHLDSDFVRRALSYGNILLYCIAVPTRDAHNGATMTTITVETREHEGMFYATSEDMPGFLLCSKNKQTLDADIFPAMKMLLAIKDKHQKPNQRVVKKKVVKELVERRELAFAA